MKFTLSIAIGMLCVVTAISHKLASQDWEYPWEACRAMDQIVGRKCDVLYYVCDYGDTWFVHDVLCNNCIGDCPPGRVFDNGTESCVWPNTIGCGCSEIGQRLGSECDDKYYVCELNSGDWFTSEVPCDVGTYYNPVTQLCESSGDINC